MGGLPGTPWAPPGTPDGVLTLKKRKGLPYDPLFKEWRDTEREALITETIEGPGAAAVLSQEGETKTTPTRVQYQAALPPDRAAVLQ